MTRKNRSIDYGSMFRHIALDCSHLEKREQLLEEEKTRRAVNFIANKEQLTTELADVEV